MEFDTFRAAQRLREVGADKPLAEVIVEAVVNASDEHVTRDHFDQRTTLTDQRIVSFEHRMNARVEAFRAEMYRALAIQGGIILGGVGVIVTVVEAL